MKKGRNIIGRLGYGLLGLMAVMGLAGCGKETAREPVTVTIWHVYGGQAESPLNDMIAEFNETVGKEENIQVQVGSVTNTNTIHENVLSSAFGDPGQRICRICLFPIRRQYWHCLMRRFW